MLTLSVDRAGTCTGRGFESSEDAFVFVTMGRYVGRLMQALGVKRWLCVLEFQKAGWPHWHVLVDRFVPVKRVVGLWCGRWGICGSPGIDVDRERKPGALGRYLAQYLSDIDAVPAWVVDRGGVRFVSCSRSVQCLALFLGKCRSEPPAVPGDSDYVEPDQECRVRVVRERRTLRVRLAECGQGVTAIWEVPDGVGGVQPYYLKPVPGLNLRDVVRWADRVGALAGEDFQYNVTGWYRDVALTGELSPWVLASGAEVVGWRAVRVSVEFWFKVAQYVGRSSGGVGRTEWGSGGESAVAA